MGSSVGSAYVGVDGTLRSKGDLRMTHSDPVRTPPHHAQPEPTAQRLSDAPGYGDAMRPVAVFVVVGVAAMASATVLRPRAGYTRIGPVLVASAAGAGLAVAALVAAGLVNRHRHGATSLRHAMIAWPGMALVLLIFVGVVAVPRIVAGTERLLEGAASSKAVEQADFSRWQQTVAPLAGAYISAVRADAVFLPGLPLHPTRRLLGAIRNTAARLAHLRELLAEHAARLPSSHGLSRFTNLLEQGLALANRAQRALLLAAEAELSDADTAGADRRLRALRRRGLGQLRRSEAAMTAFSLGANKLGGSLFAQRP